MLPVSIDISWDRFPICIIPRIGIYEILCYENIPRSLYLDERYRQVVILVARSRPGSSRLTQTHLYTTALQPYRLRLGQFNQTTV